MEDEDLKASVSNDDEMPKLKRARRSISLEQKLDVLKRFEKGGTLTQIGKALHLSKSTVATILNQKVKILENVEGASPMQSKRFRPRGSIMQEMEKLLILWIQDETRAIGRPGMTSIQNKAKEIFNQLKERGEGSSSEETFQASHGWFHRFQCRAKHNEKGAQEEAILAAKTAAEECRSLAKIIEDGGYSARQVFNVEETCLFWNRKPNHSFLNEEEKPSKNSVPVKQRLNLLLGGNAEGDFKLKPLLIFGRDKPKSLQNQTKSQLPVIWKKSRKHWVTPAVFDEWCAENFIPAFRRYCSNNKLEFKALIIVDSALRDSENPGELDPNIQIVSVPPLSSLVQVEQGVIAAFKTYYARYTEIQANQAIARGVSMDEFYKKYDVPQAVMNIDFAWRSISQMTMIAAWRKLCPQFVTDTGTDETVEDFEKNMIHPVEEEVKADYLNEMDFIKEEEISCPDDSDEEVEIEDDEEEFDREALATGLKMMQDAVAWIVKHDPDAVRSSKFAEAIKKETACYTELNEEKPVKLYAILNKLCDV